VRYKSEQASLQLPSHTVQKERSRKSSAQTAMSFAMRSFYKGVRDYLKNS
jgi:hypothetical protein